MRCVICKQGTEFIAHALLAPWLSKLIEGNEIRSRLFQCSACDFKFFEYRYTETEINQIYSSYRSGRYASLRKIWEPWYTSGINDLYKNTEASVEISKRKNRMLQQFDKATVEIKFRNCLDFGGDDGQFFPEAISGNRYLIEASAITDSIDENKIRIAPSIEAIPEDLDLIMCCMAMEHLSSFDQFMTAVRKKLVHSSKGGGLFYVEIPMDGFRVGKWARTDAYFHYLTLVSKFPPIFIALDFLTGLVRNYFKVIPIFGIVKQSEHINYFSRKAIAELLNKELKVLFVSEDNLREKYGHFRLGFLAAIARRM